MTSTLQSNFLVDDDPTLCEFVMANRKIIHVDTDALYASVEQRDNPELGGKPLAVGGSAVRGVVAAASYEAREFGVRSAMPSIPAKWKCPELIFVPPRFDDYRAVSAQIREIFAEHTDLVEPLSLDEAYLDVTENMHCIPIATEIATIIRTRIKEVTGLNASAGISYCKFLAKMASDLDRLIPRQPDDALRGLRSNPPRQRAGSHQPASGKRQPDGACSSRAEH